MSIPEHLEPTVRTLPTTPGCYLYYNAQGDVIYVGKAVNLRNRVRSYFNPASWIQYPKTGRLSATSPELSLLCAAANSRP